MYNMFFNCSGLTSLDLSNFDTSNVTNMGSMFGGCKSLTSLDLSSFDTSNVTNMNCMFSMFGYYASNSMKKSNLETLNLSNWNTSNVTNMSLMFHNCSKLYDLDLSYFKGDSVTDLSWMFYDSSVESLNLYRFTTINASEVDKMFYTCKNLRDLYWNNFGRSKFNAIDFGSCTNLGVVSETYPSARENLTFTFVNGSFDRAGAGLSNCTLTFASTTKALFTDDEIATITAKGYTIA